MTPPTYDHDFWERLWAKTLREHPDKVASRPPNAHLVAELAERLASGIAPGGTLFLVGHRPIDPATGAPTAAAGQTQVSVEGAVAALDPAAWEWAVAEERPRTVAGSGVDAVLRARRRP